LNHHPSQSTLLGNPHQLKERRANTQRCRQADRHGGIWPAMRSMLLYANGHNVLLRGKRAGYSQLTIHPSPRLCCCSKFTVLFLAVRHRWRAGRLYVRSHQPRFYHLPPKRSGTSALVAHATPELTEPHFFSDVM